LCVLTSATVFANELQDPQATVVREVFGVLTLAFSGLNFMMEMVMLLFMGVTWVWNKRIPFSHYFLDVWNYFDIPVYGALIAISAVNIINDFGNLGWDTLNESGRSVFALCILYLWVKNFEWASAFSLTSQTVRTLYLILGQIFIYMVLVFVMVIGFAHAMYIMVFDRVGSSDPFNVGFGTLPRSLASIWFAFIGQLKFDDIEKDGTAPVTYIVYFFFSLFGSVIMLNLLIATMSNVYDQVRSDALYASLKTREKFVCDTIKVFARTNALWSLVVRNVLFPRDTGLPGLIGPALDSDNYEKHPWSAGTFYTSKQTSGKETTLSALSEIMKSTAVVIDQIDSRTEDILTKVEATSVDETLADEDQADYDQTAPAIQRAQSQRRLLQDSTKQIFSKKS